MRRAGMFTALTTLAFMGAGTSWPLVRGVQEPPLPPRVNRRSARAFLAAERDHYFGIKSKGRTGAAARAGAMARAFEQTAVGRRSARGRRLSNPFKSPKRMLAFIEAGHRGLSRNEAMKVARRATT